MTVGVATLLALGLLGQAPSSDWPSLREVLAKHEINAACCDDADRRITSFEVHADPAWFAIAYYWHTGTDSLPRELRIRTLDRRAGRWRSAVLDSEALEGGSAVGLGRAGRWVYLNLHVNPSAGTLVVLSEDLTVRKRLNGWSSAILPDGRVAYEHSMVHLAPFHTGSISLYDPRTDRDVRLYPARPDAQRVDRPLDRSIHPVEAVGRQRIRIGVVERRLKWKPNRDGVEPDGPEQRFIVTCDVSGATPRCVRGPLIPAAGSALDRRRPPGARE